MRTIGFAYEVINDPKTTISEDGKLVNNGLQFIGVTAIADPVGTDVPATIEECTRAGIQVKIVTGNIPNTAKKIARQIRLWDESYSDINHIIGARFAAMNDIELLERIPCLCAILRTQPLDKTCLVNLLQQHGEIITVTGDDTNDVPALKAAQAGLPTGDGTSVAKEASDITILDNSFSSVGKAVIWGRPLYLNIQRLILFQMIINATACTVVFFGAFLGVQSPLTVTQILWVNLIMDTFTVLALAFLPLSQRMMSDPLRQCKASIITKEMAHGTFGAGGLFVLLLFGFIQYFKSESITGLIQLSVTNYLTDFFHFGSFGNGLSVYEPSLFLSIFVALQFWSMFSARTYHTGRSAFVGIDKSQGFIMMAAVIIIGQVVIITFGGTVFSVTPLLLTNWYLIIAATNSVSWIGELLRLIKR